MGFPASPDRPEMEGTITCPHCGQMLAASCRVCVSCRQPIDPDALRLPPVSAPATVLPEPELALPPARFSWPIFFLVLAASWSLAALVVHFFGPAAAQVFFTVLTIGSSIWVIGDANARRIRKPWRWGAASLLLWIVFFPWYVSRRRTPRAPCAFVEGERSRLPLLLVGLLILQFVLTALIMKQGILPLH